MLVVGDFHVHIGASSAGQPVKVTASRDLTFAHIARECVQRKGVDVVGIVDCASPAVLADIEIMLDSGEMEQLDGGGLRYQGQLTVLLGAEIETREPGRGMSHHVSYFAHIGQIRRFSQALKPHITNLNLSSQACGMGVKDLCALTLEHEGLFVPAHCFTPHKSLYGACTDRAAELLGEYWEAIPAIELGLSADAELADRIGELEMKTYLSNSDAHSLPRIAREYNILEVEAPTFAEIKRALWREEGRRVVANFGLDPRLGKYHRTCCEECRWIARAEPPVLACEQCGSTKATRGVLDRLTQIADYSAARSPGHRPPYQYQVPLQFVPGVGAVMLERLINRFGSEMAVLHQASRQELGETVGEKVAELIMQARAGTLPLEAGGGGRYGRALRDRPQQFRLPGV